MIVNKSCLAASTAIALLISNPATAATVNGTGNVTSDVIFGSGNANGSFTGVRVETIELALRAKLRYDLSGQPQNTFNYDGKKTYTFNSAMSNAPANRSIFNFEWAINVDRANHSNALSLLTYLIDVDLDPTVKIGNVVSYDPLGLGGTGYYLGTSATPNGGGIDAVTAYFQGINVGNRNVAQQSVNMGFAPISTPVGSGQYTIGLTAFYEGRKYAATSINVIVDAPAPIPLPAGLSLLAGAVGLLAFVKRRRARA